MSNPDFVRMDALTAILYDKLEAVFGSEPTLEAQMGKLAEEIDEFLEELDLGELADVVVVCCTIARVCGHSVEELMDTVRRKMERNAARKWGVGDGKVARHIEGPCDDCTWVEVQAVCEPEPHLVLDWHRSQDQGRQGKGA